GLSVPVHVKVAGRDLDVGADAHVPITLKPGHYVFQATLKDGEVLEEQQADIPRWTDLVFYNVLGSAPAYVEEVVYSAGPGSSEEGKSTPLAGKHFHAQDDVPYVFQEPPSEIKLSSHSKAEHRNAFWVA